MCGITGWIDWHRDLSQQDHIVNHMTETLIPRGPDAKGIWLSRHVVFGHRRLSIIDPENGLQPMTYRKDQQFYTIVYNGELYNTMEIREELESKGYTFRTQCDTEVLLTAYVEWGIDALERLNGIYAFAIWDEAKSRIVLARDRIGVKPLFFAKRDSSFILLPN